MFTPPPPLGGSAITQPPPPHEDTSSPYFSSASAASSSSSSAITVMIIIASAVIVSASIYLLLLIVSKRSCSAAAAAAGDVVVQRREASSSNQQHKCHVAFNDLLETLPLFSFRSVTGNLAGGDCAVCLSRFEPHDQLRLLPLCCHAFHAACIDTWIASNQTCPLCRSTVIPCGSDALDKILSSENGNENRRSFRIEIGSISHRSGEATAAEAAEGAPARRSYSMGSFEYIVDDNTYEVSVDWATNHRRGVSNCSSNEKDSVQIPVPEPPGEILAAEVSGGRSWLREYVDRLSLVSISSRAMSFRSSGRFFTGSSRRSDAAVVPDDLEANRAGEEISEIFRWLSGI